MKLLTNNLLESLNFQEVKNLTVEVKETLFLNFKIGKSKNFTSAQLWNIQRQRKNISGRRFCEY